MAFSWRLYTNPHLCIVYTNPHFSLDFILNRTASQQSSLRVVGIWNVFSSVTIGPIKLKLWQSDLDIAFKKMPYFIGLRDYKTYQSNCFFLYYAVLFKMKSREKWGLVYTIHIWGLVYTIHIWGLVYTIHISVNCCFSKLALSKSNKTCWFSSSDPHHHVNKYQ
jgi:hypothetical protein